MPFITPDKWTVNPKTTLVVRFTYPDNNGSEEGVQWAGFRFPPQNIIRINKLGLEPARNTAVRDICLKSPAEFTDFIFMDRDVRPCDESDFFLTLDTDLASCMCESRSMLSWANPAAFHLPLSRIRRKVLEAMVGPWFKRPLTADGCSYESCECVYFLKRALELGFTSSHAGWARHDSEGSHGH